jgi:hypothetical protein
MGKTKKVYDEQKKIVKALKEKLINDIVTALNMKKNLISEDMQINSIHLINYKWTEAFGKYEGNPYWSLKALEKYNKSRGSGEIIHEHIVPRREIRKKLLNSANSNDLINYNYLEDIFVPVLIGVIITDPEDKLFNVCGFRQNHPEGVDIVVKPWERYKQINEYKLFEQLVGFINGTSCKLNSDKVKEINCIDKMNGKKLNKDKIEEIRKILKESKIIDLLKEFDISKIVPNMIIILEICNELQDDVSKLEFKIYDEIIPFAIDREELFDETEKILKKINPNWKLIK